MRFILVDPDVVGTSGRLFVTVVTFGVYVEPKALEGLTEPRACTDQNTLGAQTIATANRPHHVELFYGGRVNSNIGGIQYLLKVAHTARRVILELLDLAFAPFFIWRLVRTIIPWPPA